VFSESGAKRFADSIAETCDGIPDDSYRTEQDVADEPTDERGDVCDDDVMSPAWLIFLPGYRLVKRVPGTSYYGIENDKGGHAPEKTDGRRSPQPLNQGYS